MTDGICQFFTGRLRPPRKAPQLIDDTHESTHERLSAPFWKAKNYAARISAFFVMKFTRGVRHWADTPCARRAIRIFVMSTEAERSLAIFKPASLRALSQAF